MSASPAIVSSPRDQWLARRRELITASDVAAILGEDIRRGPLAVWCAKTGGIEADENEAMVRGRDFEDAIARTYGRQTGRPVGALPDYEISIHSELPWLGATLDRKTLATKAMPDPFGAWDDGDGSVSRVRAPLQLKMATGSAHEWKDEPPLGYVVQVQVEMACVGSSWAALAALVGPGPLAIADLAYSDGFFRALVPMLEKFRWHVAKRIPPEADGKPGTTEAIKRMWAQASGETVALDADALRIVEDWEGAKARQEAAKETATELSNKLRARMGAATFGALNDGSFVRLRPQTRKAYEVEAAGFRVLDRWWPKLRRL